MLDDLTGKVAVITGAGSGIGEGLARACAAEGMHVVVADVDQARADTVAASLDGAGSALAVAVDVSDADAVERFAALVYDTYGATHLLCNNAGVCPFGRLWEFTAADWQWIVGVNLFGVANGRTGPGRRDGAVGHPREPALHRHRTRRQGHGRRPPRRHRPRPRSRSRPRPDAPLSRIRTPTLRSVARAGRHAPAARPHT